jgi:hypothetical protein
LLETDRIVDVGKRQHGDVLVDYLLYAVVEVAPLVLI